jgi:hypothetical protein
LFHTFIGNPRQSERRNALTLKMSGRTVRWILHQDLNSCPYKMIMVQAINYQNNENWKTPCENLLKAQDNDDINHILMADEANFILLALSVLRTDGIEQLRTFAMFIRNLYILRMFCLVLCSIFWIDRSLVLWRRGRQSSNPLNLVASYISGTGFGGTWCWSSACLVSARRGNGSHCEECSTNSHRGVPS